jgi:hypothetical protein
MLKIKISYNDYLYIYLLLVIIIVISGTVNFVSLLSEKVHILYSETEALINQKIHMKFEIENLKKELDLKAKNTANYWAIFLGFILICIIVILWVLFSPSGVPEKEVRFSKYEKAPKDANISYISREISASNKNINSLKENIKSLQYKVNSSNSLNTANLYDYKISTT